MIDTMKSDNTDDPAHGRTCGDTPSSFTSSKELNVSSEATSIKSYSESFPSR